MKVIVDTSIWISHLHKPVAALVSLLETGDVLMHSSVIGELACGYLHKRNPVLANLKLLPFCQEANPDETLRMIEIQKLYGKGLGWTDCQLLSSAALSGSYLLTEDQALTAAALRLGMRWPR